MIKLLIFVVAGCMLSGCQTPYSELTEEQRAERWASYSKRQRQKFLRAKCKRVEDHTAEQRAACIAAANNSQ